MAISGTRDIADDLAQQTCERALQKADLFEAGTHLDRWLFTLARRIWLNELRAKAVRTGGGLVAIEDAQLVDHKSSLESNISATEVFKAIGTLPVNQRETVILVYVEGYTYKEAAAILEVPIGTVMSRLATARRTISLKLTDESS